MSEIPLNKYEKEKRVIELHLAGKTIREIAKEVHMSFTPISKIIKAYERKKEVQTKREENNQSIQNKQPSIRNQFFKSYLQGNKMIDIAVELDISAPTAEKLYFEVLKLNRMDECYEFYEEHSYDIPTLLTIDHFMKCNNISSGPDITNVLRKANNVVNLNMTIINLKTEIEKLKQTKNNYSLNKNTNYQPLLPLGLPEHYYRY
jgi:DNA-binding Lrp family transcriptional regulator